MPIRSSLEQRVIDLEALGGSVDVIYSLPYAAKTGTYTITTYDYLINCTSNTFTVTLPTAVSAEGRSYVVKNSGSGVITLDANGSQTIDGELNVTLNQYDSITVVSDGANWIIV